MKKLLFIILSCLTLTSCSFGHIEDSNGVDDYSLVTITNEEIIDNSNFYVQTMSSQVVINGKYTVKINKFSGVKSINDFNKQGQQITINSTITLNEGNLKICLVNEHEIEYEFNLFGSDSYTFKVGNDCKLVIAGESANFKMEYTI